jgi:uncharacterized protein YdiU (UPF0061 family)
MVAQIEAVDVFRQQLRPPAGSILCAASVAAPRLVRLNEKLAWRLRLDPGMLAAPEGVEILAGNRVPKRGEPLAMAYAGHRQSDPRTGRLCGACGRWPTSTFVLAEFVVREFMEPG